MKKLIIFTFLLAARKFRALLSKSENAYKYLFMPGFEGIRWQIGKWKAWHVYETARRNTPAYQHFLEINSTPKIKLRGWDPDLTQIPVMDKESYIKKYSIEARCAHGVIPKSGVVIDESSGTSGTPNNWVRGPQERAAVKRTLQIALRSHFGNKPIFIINAFALGPWATGMNVSMSLVDISILKSTGPDIKKIENTLKFFGPSYNYLIMGYPPFLKSLIDTADIEWSNFSLASVYGGEGMTEGMRDYLGKVFKKSYGSYGASDLEINIAAENNFTIALRQLLAKNPELAKKILHHTGSLPMIFQYNPLDYFIETNEEGELLITLCRNNNVAPKVRYNIHDLGHVLRIPELKKILAEHNLQIQDISAEHAELPILFHYGRADMSVAFYGCKITPANIEECMFALPELAKIVNTFALLPSEDDKLNKKLVIAFELAQDEEPQTEYPQKFTQAILEQLEKVNQDYRESCKMVQREFLPTLEFYSFGSGPFAKNDIRLKKNYIQSDQKNS